MMMMMMDDGWMEKWRWGRKRRRNGGMREKERRMEDRQRGKGGVRWVSEKTERGN